MSDTPVDRGPAHGIRLLFILLAGESFSLILNQSTHTIHKSQLHHRKRKKSHISYTVWTTNITV